MCVSTPKVTMLTFPHMVTAHVVSADNSSGILDLCYELFFPQTLGVDFLCQGFVPGLIEDYCEA